MQIKKEIDLMERELIEHVLLADSIEMLQSPEGNTNRYVVNGEELDGKGISRLTVSLYGERKPFLEIEYHPEYITDKDKKILQINK